MKPAADWRTRAECRGLTAVMFPSHGQPPEPAQRVCATCQVRAECLAYVLDLPADTAGVWAGTTRGTRDQIRRRPVRAAQTLENLAARLDCLAIEASHDSRSARPAPTDPDPVTEPEPVTVEPVPATEPEPVPTAQPEPVTIAPAIAAGPVSEPEGTPLGRALDASLLGTLLLTIVAEVARSDHLLARHAVEVLRLPIDAAEAATVTCDCRHLAHGYLHPTPAAGAPHRGPQAIAAASRAAAEPVAVPVPRAGTSARLGPRPRGDRTRGTNSDPTKRRVVSHRVGSTRDGSPRPRTERHPRGLADDATDTRRDPSAADLGPRAPSAAAAARGPPVFCSAAPTMTPPSSSLSPAHPNPHRMSSRSAGTRRPMSEPMLDEHTRAATPQSLCTSDPPSSSSTRPPARHPRRPAPLTHRAPAAGPGAPCPRPKAAGPTAPAAGHYQANRTPEQEPTR